VAEKLQDNLAYPPRAMDGDRAAAYLSMSKTKFLELVEQGRMPQPVRIEDEMPRWDRLEIDSAFDAMKEKRKTRVERGRDKLHERFNK
jgi:predicted DNA-binding transcriptional regulator AlpA